MRGLRLGSGMKRKKGEFADYLKKMNAKFKGGVGGRTLSYFRRGFLT